MLAPLRYKIAFIENLITYYKQLSQASSTWGDAYEAGKQRYIETRDAIMKMTLGSARDIAEQQGFAQGFMAFVATIPYSLASGDAELYRTTAGDYEVRLQGERRQYEMAGWATGEAGKALSDCLLGALQLVIELSDKEPEEGKEIQARVKLAKGTPPKENYWYWKADGGLALASRTGAEITVTVKSEGTLTAQLIDHFDLKLAKVLAETSVVIRPKKKSDKDGDGTPQGPIGVRAPASVNSTQIFDVSGTLSPEIAAKAKSFSWESGYDTDYTTKLEAKIQYPRKASGKNEVRLRVHAGPLVDIFGGKAKSTSGEVLGEGKATIMVTELKFDGSASDIWEGGPYDTDEGGISFRRKPQYRKRTEGGKEVNSASASGSVSLDMTRDHKDIDCSVAWQLGGKPVPEGHTVRSLTIGPFKGDLIEKTFTSGYRGHYQFVDVAYPEAGASGKGCVSFGRLAIQIGYSAGASGTRLGEPSRVSYDDMPWVKAKTKEIQSEIQSIIASVKLVPDGKRHTEPYKEKEIPIPVVKLQVSKDGKLKKGEIVDVTCIVENAPDDEKPLTYTWTGDHAGSGEKVQFLAAKGGKATLSVSVSGKQGAIGSASKASSR